MAGSPLIPVLWGLIFLQVALQSTVAQKVPSVDVIGVVYCDQCLEHAYTKNSVLLKGASVAIDCKDKTQDVPYRVVALTDDSGSFKARLAPWLHDSEGQIDCSAYLLSSSDTQCKGLGISTKKSWAFLLQSRKADNVIYNAGDFTFLPQAAASPFCSEAAIKIPSISGIPKPKLQLPKLPPLPKLPKLPSVVVPPKPKLPHFHLPKLPHLPLPLPPPLPPLPKGVPPIFKPKLPTKPSSLQRVPFSELPTHTSATTQSISTSSPISLSNPISKLPHLPRPAFKFPPIPKFTIPRPKLTIPKPKFSPRLPKFPPLPKVTIPKIKFPSSPPSP